MRAKLPIVIIDDDEDCTMFIVRALKRAGAPNPICAFTDTASALQFFERANDDGSLLAPAALVICDIHIPGDCGFRVVEKLRTLPKMDDVPICMFSTSLDRREHERAIEAGADEFFAKYPSREALATLIDTANARQL
jgi:CheY-like chemotaxis protein